MPPRSARTLWPLIFYLAGFTGLLWLVCFGYLIPAASALPHATDHEKLGLAAYSRLLLAVVLFVLFVGLLLTFRTHQFFLPRHRGPEKPTKYVDAWAEAGRRFNPKDETKDENG